ncbi:TIP41-like protein [Trema orientale]|uniref:TIP41-like protein n=1 Tax=Trema orientale TaxID=63057 RepID=A0A2P5EQ56_TREOI|nr:TIP41-like protein [Trema orientale]
MASKSLDDAEFWLPSQFLTDDDVLMGKENFHKNGAMATHGSFPTEFPYEFDSFGSNSALSSPVESVVSSTETESSDEEDFFAGLTRRFAQSNLRETQKLTVPCFGQEKPEWVLAGSPQSTLSGIGSWSGRSTISSNGSPNGPSQVVSPPTTPFGANNDTWDLIYAAAGQVARLKISNEEAKLANRGRGLLGPPRIPSPLPPVRNPNNGLYSDQSLSQNLAQFQALKPDMAVKPQCASAWGRQMKVGWSSQAQVQAQAHQQNHPYYHQQIQNRARNTGYEHGRCGRALNLPQSAWPPLQVQSQNQQPLHNRSSMGAVPLAGSGVKRECAGTGVFLPRRYNNPTESRKKSACPNVLLPAKVVQALNLNFEDTNGYSQPRFGCNLGPDHEALMARRNAILEQQRRSLRPDVALNHEVRLPQEWTY